MADSQQPQGKLASGVQDLNQEMKERDVQARAKAAGLPYANLLKIPLDPDLANVVDRDSAVNAGMAIFFRSGKKLKVGVTNVENPKTKSLIGSLTEAGYEVEVNLVSDESLVNGQKIYYSDAYQKQEEIENVVLEQDLGSVADEIAGLQGLKEKIEAASYDVGLNYVQVGAYKTQSSDIHFQPEEGHVTVRFRVDGVLKPVFDIAPATYDGILREIKYLSNLKLNITTIPQDGQYSFKINDRQINVRVSTLPTHYGEATVMRLLDAERAKISFEDLGFEGVALEHIKEAVSLNHGMVLVTGPTGSGKTTTLYSMLQSIDTKTKKVITLEDPIEYNLEGISQSQIAEDKEYDFASGLRAILRQDPDVIMLGEIRDLETAETAAQASLTGHLVFSTLHTNSAVESIPRLVNMGVKSFILAPAIDLIVAQRLVRKLCPDCSAPRALSETERAHIQETFDKLKEKGIEPPEMPAEIKAVSGCEMCGDTGYKGQIAITEVLRFDDGLRNAILDNKPMPEIYEYIDKQSKMLTLHEDGILKVVRGLSTLEEVERVAK